MGENKAKVGTAIGIGSLIAIWLGSDPETIIRHLGELAQSQIAQTGFFFTIAAWLHSGRVKKEIASQFNFLTDAINNVAYALRQDLAKQSERLDIVDSRVTKVEAIISTKGEEK